MMCIQEIYNICHERVDRSLLPMKNFSLCIDGTSATKKTSILEATGCMYVKHSKIQPSVNPNTYFPSFIGYITSGVNNLLCGGPHFVDRSPANVFDWCLLWKFMDEFACKFGNTNIDYSNNEMMRLLDSFRETIELQKTYVGSDIFLSEINTIAFIDSNVDRCNELRYMRNKNTDQPRSTWSFYTPLQNFFYKEKYKGLIIDMAWFDGASSDDVITGVAAYLKNTLDYIAENTVGRTFSKLIDTRLPIFKRDYAMANMSTHVYRSIARSGCQSIINKTSDNLRNRIPSYVSVDNISSPAEYPLCDQIIAKDVNYLLDYNNDNIFEQFEDASLLNNNNRLLFNNNTADDDNDNNNYYHYYDKNDEASLLWSSSFESADEMLNYF